MGLKRLKKIENAILEMDEDFASLQYRLAEIVALTHKEMNSRKASPITLASLAGLVEPMEEMVKNMDMFDTGYFSGAVQSAIIVEEARRESGVLKRTWDKSRDDPTKFVNVVLRADTKEAQEYILRAMDEIRRHGGLVNRELGQPYPAQTPNESAQEAPEPVKSMVPATPTAEKVDSPVLPPLMVILKDDVQQGDLIHLEWTPGGIIGRAVPRPD